ncbi:hypothetical protein CAEBREN_21805 [Caenorhabditis brenneri]|uniref:Sdz-33 F-box domain-containing protein n=1 Tax=Caenorhabditis brenneri TaxID=135651 RepID=G0N0A8_CAEBE|nr:hypothetical protein CAEBREN_21805 [Caenorhabditis brenneri]
MAVAPSFPLYELPKDELRWVIRLMDPVALLNRSSTLTCDFYMNGSVPKEIVSPSDVIFHYGWDGPVHKWKQDGYEAKDWLDHFKTTFHLKEFFLSFDDYAAEVNIDFLYTQFGTPFFLYCRKNFGHEINNRILKLLAPKNSLYATTSIFENMHNRNTIFSQTLDELGMYGYDPSFTLDHLLCVNARKIVYHDSRVSLKILNKFLKLWKVGSNSRLEQLYFQLTSFSRRFSDIIMEGIPYKIVPKEENQQRRFKSWDGKIMGSWDGKAMDICRFDGTKATVCIIQRHTSIDVYFYVWHDHCIVNNVV